MIHLIGEIPGSGLPLIRMWDSVIGPVDRPFVSHRHTRFEIMTVNAGSGVYRTETDVYPIRPGDVFVFPSNAVHCITAAGEDGLSITNLHFEPRCLREETAEPSLMRFCFSCAPSFKNRIPAGEAGVLRQYHDRIRTEFLRREEHYAAAVKSCLELLLIEILRNHGYASGKTPGGRFNLSGILAVYDYIDDHLDEELTLRMLAGVACLSPNYFSHLFRKVNGVALWDYIIAKRVEKATQLILSDSSLTMSQTALLCGFGSEVNFNKAFKKCKGFPPGALRKNPSLVEQ